MELSRSLVTSASPATCFEYLSRFHRVVHWDASVVHAEKLTPGEIRVGTEFDVDVRFMGRVSRLRYVIKALDAPRYVELEGRADVYTVTDRITVHAEGTGSRVDYGLSVVYASAMRPLAPLFAPLVIRSVDQAIVSLKRALDDEPETVVPFPGWLDRLVIPGMSRFTRAGYLAGKRQWKGLSVDLTGRTVLITGATSGLGRAAALALAELGASVIAVGRDADKGEALARDIEQLTGRRPRIELADLSVIAETAALATRILEEGLRIDVLINNAGALFNRRSVTSEGLEKSFALLLLSPFVLTEMLLPCLQRSDAARVINVSSGGMYTQPVVIDDLQYAEGTYDGPKAYARAKRGLVDMTGLWSRQYGAFLHVHAMHPGWADTQAVADALPGFHRVTRPFLRSPEQGADTIVWLAAAREALQGNGLFWLDRRPHVTSIFPGTSSSPETVERLHAALCEMGQRLTEGRWRPGLPPSR